MQANFQQDVSFITSKLYGLNSPGETGMATYDDSQNRYFLIPLIAVIGFSLFLLFSYNINSDNSSRLKMIQSVYFPIFEIASSCAARLDRINELLSSAASAGEESLLITAHEQAIIMIDQLKLLRELEPRRKGEIDKVTESFKQYFITAQEVSRQMIANTNTPTPPLNSEQLDLMQKELEQTQKLLRGFRSYSHDNFLNTIEEANRSSAIGLRLGAIVGILTVVMIIIASLSIGSSQKE